jgi:hypothetical protein
VASPFYPEALGPRRCRTDLPEYQGPVNEHDGVYGLLECEKCSRLTGLGGPICSSCGGICTCQKCMEERYNDMIVSRVERALDGVFRPMDQLTVDKKGRIVHKDHMKKKP